MFPIQGNRVYWFATSNCPEGKSEFDGAPKSLLLSLFKGWHGWHEPIEALIRAADDSTILRNDIYDRDPLLEWGLGRITLLGDAAHPMTPNLGQGACQALEDALVLAHCLEQTANVNLALQLYQSRRIPRTTRIVNRSWNIGRVGQWKNPLACQLRDIGLKWLPSGLQIATFAEAVGYEV